MMQLARDLFFKAFASREAQGLRDEAGSPVLQAPRGARGRSPNLVKIWFILAVVVVISCVVLVFLSQAIFGNAKVGVFLGTVLLAVLGGWFVVFIASAKVVSALFGALVGGSADHVTSGTGFLARLQEFAAKATSALGTILPPLITLDQDFISTMVWVFLSIIVLLCLPAFFKD